MALSKGELPLTVCVGRAYRGKRYGRMIMENLIRIGSAEGRPMVSVMWADNVPSLAIARGLGFVFESKTMKDGQELERHLLSFLPERHDNS